MKASITLFSILITLLISLDSAAFAEQCTNGVHALLPWTNNINGNADQWADNANKKGFKVNHRPNGCSDKKPCVLVYPRDYGHGINPKYGHVAVLYGCGSKCKIQDSPVASRRNRVEMIYAPMAFVGEPAISAANPSILAKQG